VDFFTAMLANLPIGSNVIVDHYRCPEAFGAFAVSQDVACVRPGYFRLGKDAICYGRAATGAYRSNPDDELSDILQSLRRQGPNITLPFDPQEVIDNLRYERYTQRSSDQQRAVITTLAGKTYYLFRPMMPVSVRKQLQKLYLKGWHRIPFPSWPVDRTVDTVFERLIALHLESNSAVRMPFIWFWPKGYLACAMMTHDVETEAGRDFCTRLADIDASYGIKAAFQFVPEERYTVSTALLDSLRARGCEINVHGLNHGPHLFRDHQEFMRQAKRINYYAKQYGAAGFRSPGLYRNVEWFEALHFSYDMSVPSSAHLEPQRGGCCTVMPYFIGDMLELPLTTAQDYTLFHILNDYTIQLWKRQIDVVVQGHGLASFNTHPDYLLSDTSMRVYRQLLEHLTEFSAAKRVWIALPEEINLWWRQRRQMQLVSDHNAFKICGPGSERASVAFASLQNGRLIYEFADSSRALHAA
jgi:hypothetical protein